MLVCGVPFLKDIECLKNKHQGTQHILDLQIKQQQQQQTNKNRKLSLFLQNVCTIPDTVKERL